MTPSQRIRSASPGRLGEESGYAVVLAISILAIVGLLVAAVIAFATHSTDRAQHDRQATRALHAADAGLDAAVYRMNKALVASQVSGLLPVPSGALAELRCIEVELGQLKVVDPSGGWCPAVEGTEEIDGAGASGGNWAPAEFTYWVSTGAKLAGACGTNCSVVERSVVSTGMVGGVRKRVLGTIRLHLGTGGNLLALFEQIGYRQCTSTPPDPTDPGSGC